MASNIAFGNRLQNICKVDRWEAEECMQRDNWRGAAVIYRWTRATRRALAGWQGTGAGTTEKADWTHRNGGFCWAFDSISHQAVWDTLRKMNCGPNLISHLQTLYNGANSVVGHMRVHRRLSPGRAIRSRSLYRGRPATSGNNERKTPTLHSVPIGAKGHTNGLRTLVLTRT
jgi:hypothetical protein